MFQAVIFDFDGVILDSEPLHFKACSYVFKKLGLALSYDEYVEKYLGFSDKEMFPKFFSERGCSFSLDKIKDLIREKTVRYQEIIKQCDDLPMIDSVDQCIVNISKKIPKIAICSGSTRNEIGVVLAKLKQGRLQAYFDTIVTAEDVQRGKPSPDGYLLTAQRLNVLPNQCLVIEDTPHGVEAAKAAGMYVVALLTSYTKNQLQNADKIINNFSQLILEENKLATEN
ncbi:HAD family hydrolase [Legionella brunensis]|uniref:HAD-superfamily hydrolase n=1 Tax=Legionella brunensis TaxID=29422 RepID=A0A0W0SLH3_9GAMM|nr:HAD family phosphatase [Legionella brunensis]KTC83781.1 HAD-superfamily hydrolase [Legionella brunensis]